MKKFSSKILATILSSVMVIGMLGCGNTTANNATSESKPAAESQPAVTESSEVVVEEKIPGAGEIVYPLDTEDTLTIWNYSIKPPAAYKDYTESPLFTAYAKNVGIDLKWSFPPEGTDGATAYNLLLTEKELPDIIQYWFSAGDADELIEEGVIYDLTEYIPVYAPDYWKVIQERGLEADVKTTSGKLYGVNCLSSEFIATYIGPMIRQDWLDECGLDMPVTLEDWEETLVAFKEKYGATYGGGWPYLRSGMGAYADGFYIDDDGKLQNTAVQPEYKDYLALMAKWYDMGLIDPDIFTTNSSLQRTKALNNEMGALTAAMSQLTNLISDAEAAGNGAVWVGAPYPRTSEGATNTYIQTTANDYSGYAFVITTSCPEEKLITALRFLNYGYTEEGSLFLNLGEEGVAWERDANGNPKYTALITEDPDGLNEAVKKYNTSHTSFPTLRLNDAVMMKNRQECTDAVNQWIENSDARRHYIPEGAAMTADEQAEYNDIYSPLITYINETRIKFITGELSIEKDWDAFVAKQESFGYKRALELVQAAYDRYLALK